ncbi:MerR family transcriptional regulator [Lachnotalea sp. AF33-28]|nr:MerR family transcriptional regulator [Lachnotalea sp. AF33-28]
MDMTIKEVEEKTGLSRSNIRFYEKEGLIQPERNDKNGYRDYTEENVLEIKRIAFLRSLNLPVESIRDCVNGKIQLNALLRKQNEQLDQEIVKLTRSKNVCSRMLEDNVDSYEKLDIDHYIGDMGGYVRENRELFSLDALTFVKVWGGVAVWIALTALCLLIAAVSFYFLPERIPIQWSGGQAANETGRLVIFAYPAACVIIRLLLRPFIWRWLGNMGQADLVTDYLTNFLCFVACSAQMFTVLFVFGVMKHITAVLAVDALVFFIVLYKGLMKMSGQKQ